MSDIYNNLVTNATFPEAWVGRSKSLVEKEIVSQNGSLLTTANTAANEVTVIATFGGTATSGNYTLSVNIPTSGISYTTANIVYNAAAATIEAALDTASPATVGDGDINVAAGTTNFTDGNMTFTCSGNVATMPVLVTIADVNLAGTSPTVGAVTRTTDGQPDRNALQVLFDLGIVSGTIPATGEASVDWVKGTYISSIRPVGIGTIAWLSQQLAVEEGITTNREAVDTLYDLPAALMG